MSLDLAEGMRFEPTVTLINKESLELLGNAASSPKKRNDVRDARKEGGPARRRNEQLSAANHAHLDICDQGCGKVRSKV